MHFTSPIEVAKQSAAKLDPESNDSFAILHEVVLEFAQQKGNYGSSNDLVMAARDSIRDFIEDGLGDMTKAVPWDGLGILKRGRREVIGLVKDGLEALAAMDDPNVSQVEALETIGEARCRYLELIDELNEQDRRALNEIRGGLT